MPNRERALVGGSCTVVVLCEHHINDFESAANALALDDNVNGGVDQFANIGASQIAAAVAFFDQQGQLFNG